MIAVMATLGGLPALMMTSYFVPDDGPSAGDEGASGPSSGLAAHRRKTGECGYGLFIEVTKLGHLDERCKGCDLRHTGDRNEGVEPGLQGCILSNQGHDGFVYGLDLALDLPEPVCVLYLQQWVGKVLCR